MEFPQKKQGRRRPKPTPAQGPQRTYPAAGKAPGTPGRHQRRNGTGTRGTTADQEPPPRAAHPEDHAAPPHTPADPDAATRTAEDTATTGKPKPPPPTETPDGKTTRNERNPRPQKRPTTRTGTHPDAPARRDPPTTPGAPGTARPAQDGPTGRHQPRTGNRPDTEDTAHLPEEQKGPAPTTPTAAEHPTPLTQQRAAPSRNETR